MRECRIRGVRRFDSREGDTLVNGVEALPTSAAGPPRGARDYDGLIRFIDSRPMSTMPSSSRYQTKAE
ncbi:hypothetical protein GCM10010185_26630 [Saccharothrix coeruleofusca]|uniref:Uncharacterized protein n=1 Tax=Saccharothrix coeruleofusca TaxID=33919 RepID=A0A918EEJ8_9PSEU|nr:hypothetical protein GCM10010185_26630 [Saccharothrix coeruleofusca]